MIKRVLVLGAVAAALVVPAVSLADDGGGGGNTPATATGTKGGHAARLLERISNRLDRRFQVFSKHCLVPNAPDRCSRAANRFVRRLDRLQRVLNRVEGKIKETCGAANPPARCVNAPRVTGAIDALLGKIASDVAPIKAAFPQAGTA